MQQIKAESTLAEIKKDQSSDTHKYNYISSYIWLRKFANCITYGTYIQDIPNFQYPDSREFDVIYNRITSNGILGTRIINSATKEYVNELKTWSNILGSYANTNKNRGLIVYGMALHTATDIFAHSTLDQYNNPISHSTNKEDNTGYITNRYDCATAIANLLTRKIPNTLEGSVNDFVDVATNTYYPGLKYEYDPSTSSYRYVRFYLARFSDFVKSVNSSIYYNNQTIIDRMNKTP